MKQRYINIILSILVAIAIVCSFLRIIPTCTITAETYVGVLVSILAILVTLIITYQIFNAIEISNKLKAIDVLKNQVKNTASESEGNLYLTQAIAIMQDDPIGAFKSFQLALLMFIKNNTNESYSKVDFVLDKMDDLITKLLMVGINITYNCNKDEFTLIKQRHEIIKNNECYALIKKRYERLLIDFDKAIKKDEKE